jgi:hypothetical protein
VGFLNSNRRRDHATERKRLRSGKGWDQGLLRKRDDFDGADDWLFPGKIKPAKRAGSFNVFLIIEAKNAAFR